MALLELSEASAFFSRMRPGRLSVPRSGYDRRCSNTTLLIIRPPGIIQIAEALFVSGKTVSLHVSNILAKFGVGS
jgi:Bacterial regulatory proteins, luxR family